MKTRLLTASVGLPLLAAALWAGNVVVGPVAVVAAAVGGWELAGMASAGRQGVAARPLLVAWPAVIVALGWAVAGGAPWWLIPAAAAVGFAIALIRIRLPAPPPGLYLLVGAPYLGLLLAHAPLLRGLDHGAEWLALALFGTFAVDSAAMFTGLAIGRRPLVSRLSPGKTWEGAAGGLVGGMAAVVALDAVLGPGLSAPRAAALGAMMAVAGSLGDLGESALKRRAGVKDSGALVPGHGGLLDRLDAILPNIAIVYWVAIWSAN